MEEGIRAEGRKGRKKVPFRGFRGGSENDINR